MDEVTGSNPVSRTIFPLSKMKSSSELYSLFRLLDDDTPEVRTSISEKLLEYGGDVSEVLAEYPHPLTDSEKHLLSDLLEPARRDTLINEWVIPSGGWNSMDDDWDLLEANLRLVSDFLHDGITLRPPLTDALDILAEEARAVTDQAGIDGLRIYLFESGKFSGNREHYQDPRNSDLSWVIEEGKSNPIGLAVIFILIARRLSLPLEGVNFPGHFLCRIENEGRYFLVDCYNSGRLHDLNEIILRREQFSDQAFNSITGVATPGEILIRVLRNLEISFQQDGDQENAQLIQKLIDSLKP
jgi:Transglutaminase-like superfamily